jgi:serine phosphatase RsbU (regulator of sigma subunit)
MQKSETRKEILKWSDAIFCQDYEFYQNLSSSWPEYKKIFIDQIAEYFYKDIQRTQHLFTSPFTFKKEFGRLSEEEKSPWFDFASDIPLKLRSLNLFMHPYKDFCKTCLIPYKDLETIARADHDSYCLKHKSDKPEQGSKVNTYPDLVPFNNLPDKRRRFYIELNHLIPLELKKIGYEIIRPEEITEINEKMVRKFARAIHSRYLNEMKKQESGSKKDFYMSWVHSTGDPNNQNISDFEHLPEDIKSSNLDNAHHIPTKLLAIGYKIRPVGKGFKPATLHLDEEEIETMARVEHIRWCWDKILNGWFYGKVKDARKKTHPAIIPYEDLSESEKEKDRELVRLIPALLQDIHYEVYPANPDKIRKLSYAIRPHSSIHKLLDDTREMNTEISQLARSSPEIEKKVRRINKKIEETIGEVRGNYNYAQHIQESFLPDYLYIRECFSDSFVLFLPKDIVSGDFYFFSKRDHQIVFAAADCTGHGIPGAMLSTVGYGILDQAVTELRMTDPSAILKHLYSKMHRFLQVDTSTDRLSDDMDIALCTMDTRSDLLTFAGVNHPLYLVSGGEITEYRTRDLSDNRGDDGEYLFTSERIQLKHGDTIYLCSDGYADQFGGKHHKKYQTARFKNFLLNIQGYSMPEQSDRLFEEIERWREENNEDQTDDILVIGIKI